MVNIELIKKIKDSLAKGNSFDFVRRDLISQHWDPSEVDDAINFVESNKSISDIEMPVKSKQTFPIGAKIFIGVIFVLIIVGLLIFYLINYSRPPISYITISEFNILEGVNVNAAAQSQINFTYESQDYFLKIEDVAESSASFSGDVEGKLNLGDEIYFDLDEDFSDDIKIRLDLISNGIANLYLKSISEIICPENWNCTGWGPCLSGSQKRVCVDLNSCGTELNKPDLEINCDG